MTNFGPIAGASVDNSNANGNWGMRVLAKTQALFNTQLPWS